jgi:Lar family restriction alleviation protein
MVKLKPCPFCGGEARGWCRSATLTQADEIDYNGYVSCTKCPAKMRSTYQHVLGPEAIADAARNWNSRAGTTPSSA